MDYKIYKQNADVFLSSYELYKDQIKNSYSAIIFRDNFYYRVEWRRTPFSKIKSLGFMFVKDYLISELPDSVDCPDVMFCTPEKVSEFLHEVAISVNRTIGLKEYEMNRDKLKEGAKWHY